MDGGVTISGLLASGSQVAGMFGDLLVLVVGLSVGLFLVRLLIQSIKSAPYHSVESDPWDSMGRRERRAARAEARSDRRRQRTDSWVYVDGRGRWASELSDAERSRAR